MAGSGSGRGSIPAAERLKVWVRSGGRCAMCGTYLLEGKFTHQGFSLGELAHIVGAQQTKRSPRGGASLPKGERNLAENLMLLCAGEHDEIDRTGAVDVLTVERLTSIKQRHEDWVRRMTGLDRNRGTSVLRMMGRVRGTDVELSKATASDAVLQSDDRFPKFPLSYDQHGFEIDLRHVPGETTAAYWRAAQDIIDEILDHKLADAIRKEAVQHLSIFGFARLPLLIYLGSRIDDTYKVDVYQRHRATSSWAWPATAASPTQFGVDDVPIGGLAGDDPNDAVLVLNVSGTIRPDELPKDVRTLKRKVIAPRSGTPAPDTIDSLASLDAFIRQVRDVLSEFEVTDKRMPVLHVFGALPVSAAIALGRVRDSHVHPPFHIYERTRDGDYQLALEIS